MPSPFPGMNPYLEQDDVWEDFHGRLIPALAERLERDVGSHYIVKIEPRLYIRELADDERHFLGRSDVGVASHALQGQAETSTALADAPVELLLPESDSFREYHVEIRDRRDRRMVTAIEILSPTNKTPGANRELYLAKRRELMASTTHLVEIDLRRGGVRPPLGKLPACHYYVMVSDYRDRPRLGGWPIELHDRLPVITVPLIGPEESVRLDLQAALNQVYDSANYGKYIYESQPQPPLTVEENNWAIEILSRASGVRPLG